MFDAKVLREGLDRSSLMVIATSASGRVEFANLAATAFFGSLEGVDLASPPPMEDPKGPLATFVGLWEAVKDDACAGMPTLLRSRAETGSLYLWTNVVPAGKKGAGHIFFLADLTAQISGSEPVRRMVSQLAHDLRSPLTSIAGAAELLLSGRVGGLETTQAKLIRIVDEGANRMANIISTVSSEERNGGPSA